MDRDVVRVKPFRASRSLLVLPEIGFCLSRCLFNSPRVMILVACQGGPSSKCLLAIRIGAFVRSLAGMDSAMPS